MASVVALVVNLVKIKVVSPGEIKKSGVRRHVIAVETISRNVRSVVSKAMSIVMEVEGRHAQKHRVGAITSRSPKALAECHVLSKVLGVLEAMVQVDLMIVPNGPNAKVFLDRIRMIKMIGNEEVALEIFWKVVTREVETKKV